MLVCCSSKHIAKGTDKDTATYNALTAALKTDCDTTDHLLFDRAVSDTDATVSANSKLLSTSSSPSQSNHSEPSTSATAAAATASTAAIPMIVIENRVGDRSSCDHAQIESSTRELKSMDKSRDADGVAKLKMLKNKTETESVKLKMLLPESEQENETGNSIASSSFPSDNDDYECLCMRAFNFMVNCYEVRHFTNALFLVYLVGQSVGCTNYLNHFVFIVPRAIEIGVSKIKAAQLLSIVGLFDLIGRVLGGFVADFPGINRGYLMGASIMCIGATSIVTTMYPSYASLVVLSVVLGFVGGTYVCLLAVVLIDFLGLAKFSSAFGLAVMVQGLTNTGWPTFLGTYLKIVPLLWNICAIS